MNTAEAEYAKITDKLRHELKKIYDLFPHIRELLKIKNLCKYLGFSDELIKMILEKSLSDSRVKSIDRNTNAILKLATQLPR